MYNINMPSYIIKEANHQEQINPLLEQMSKDGWKPIIVTPLIPASETTKLPQYQQFKFIITFEKSDKQM